METRVGECRPGDDLWPDVAGLFPRAVAHMADTADDGDYHFFAAVDEAGRFLGGSVVDVGPMGFGPLADATVGFLEDIEVLEPHRRRGVGSALLGAALRFAWDAGAEHVRWTVDYGNAAAIALYRGAGALFIPEEDPGAAEPERCYTVVVGRPAGPCARTGQP